MGLIRDSNCLAIIAIRRFCTLHIAARHVDGERSINDEKISPTSDDATRCSTIEVVAESPIEPNNLDLSSLSTLGDRARSHFLWMVHSRDRCHMRRITYLAENRKEKDVNRLRKMGSKHSMFFLNLTKCLRPQTTQRILRVMAAYDDVEFLAKVGVERSSYENVINLLAYTTPLASFTEDFLTMISFLVLNKENRSRRFPALEARLIDEARRRTITTRYLHIGIEFFEAIYRLNGGEFDETYKRFLRQFLWICNAITPNEYFRSTEFGIVCYAMTLSDTVDVQLDDCVLDKVAKLANERRTFLSKDVLAMICYFCIKFERHKTDQIHELRQYCREFLVAKNSKKLSNFSKECFQKVVE